MWSCYYTGMTHPTLNMVEWERRSRENIEACKRFGQVLTPEDEQTIGMMVLRIMKAEAAQRENSHV